MIIISTSLLVPDCISIQTSKQEHESSQYDQEFLLLIEIKFLCRCKCRHVFKHRRNKHISEIVRKIASHQNVHHCLIVQYLFDMGNYREEPHALAFLYNPEVAQISKGNQPYFGKGPFRQTKMKQYFQ